MSRPSHRHINWKCFARHTDNDANLQQEILGLFAGFLVQLPQEINVALQTHNCTLLHNIVHKGKPTLSIFQCKRLMLTLERLLAIVQSEQASEKLAQEIHQSCEEILSELAQYTEVSASL